MDFPFCTSLHHKSFFDWLNVERNSRAHLFSFTRVVQRLTGLFFGGLNAASTLSVIVVVIYGAYLTIMGHLTAGSLTSFILYSLTGIQFTCYEKSN